MHWVAPAALAATVLGALALLRHQTLQIRQNDYVALNPTSFAPPAGLPFALPQNSRVLVRVDTVGRDGMIQGQAVGYVDPQTGQPILPLGGGGGLPTPGIRREWVTGIYRGNPPKLLT